jgi:hypothetical protein
MPIAGITVQEYIPCLFYRQRISISRRTVAAHAIGAVSALRELECLEGK